MNDKFIGMLVISGVAVPACLVCAVGVTAAGSMMTGILAWLGGFGDIVSIALALTIGFLIFRTIRRRKFKDTEALVEQGKQEG